MAGARRGVSAAIALLAGLVLSVGIAACGGQKIAADEVTVAPPELTVPTSTEGADDALSSEDPGTSDTTSSTSSTDEGTTAGDANPDDTTDSGSAGGSATPTPQATPTPASGGAQAPAQEQPSTGGSAAPAPGSGSQKFEQFCEQNAGAC